MKDVMRVQHSLLWFTVIACAMLLAFAFPFVSHAQLDSYVSQTAVSLSLSPEHPSPGNSVHIEAKSALFDLPSSDMIWYVDGHVVAEGAGLASRDVVAGSAGSETSIRVIVSQTGIGMNCGD